MISAETSTLVANGMRSGPAKPAAPVSVRTLRGVMLGGVRVEPGTVLQLAPALAAELVYAGKAEHHTAPPAKAAAAKPAPAKD